MFRLPESRPFRLIALALCLSTAAGCSGTWLQGNVGKAKTKTFKVYCVNETLQVDERPLSEMRMVRGERVSICAERPTQSEAQKEAERLGGIGSRCTCGQT